MWFIFALASAIFALTKLSLCFKDLSPIASLDIPLVLIMFCKSLMFEKSNCVLLFSVLFKVFPPRLKISQIFLNSIR